MDAPRRMILVGLLLVTAVFAHGSPGTLDTTFRAGTIRVFAGLERGRLDDAGRLYVVGSFTSWDGTPRERLARLLSNGQLDAGFVPDSSLGAGATPYGSVSAVVPLPAGQVMLGGRTRLKADGSVDPGYRLDSRLMVQSAPQFALLADGKYLLAGQIQFSDFVFINGEFEYVEKYALAVRLHPDGTLDDGYDGGWLELETDADITSVVVQADGKAVIGGSFALVPGDARLGIARLKTDGALDPSFVADWPAGLDVDELCLEPDGQILVRADTLTRLHADGRTDTSFRPQIEPLLAIDCLTVQADGRILLGGRFTDVNGVDRPGLARLLPNGELDAGFSPVVPASYGSSKSAIQAQADGRILVLGEMYGTDLVPRQRVFRFEPDGRLDPTYDTGIGPTTETSANAVNALALDADGRILIAGRFNYIDRHSRNGVARLNPDGSVDTTFDPASAAGASGVNSLAVQTDGKVVVGGKFTTFARRSRFGLARMLPDGSLDTNFPANVTAPFLPRTVNALALPPGGGVIVGGEFSNFLGVSKRNLARIKPDGACDTGFGSDSGPNRQVTCLAMQVDGKVIIGGYFDQVDGQPRRGIARMGVDGRLDPSFDPGSGLQSRTGAGWAGALAVEPDGDVLVAGWFESVNGVARTNLVRLKPDGAVDATFDAGAWPASALAAVALDTEEKVLVGGYPQWIGSERHSIFRLGTTGGRDAGFETGSGEDGAVLAVLRQEDGRILIAGEFNRIDGVLRPRLARLMGEGTPAADPPVIVAGPTNITVRFGEALRLEVIATGAPPLTYAWTRNGAVVTGQSNAVLAIASVGAGDAGEYIVRVSNADGSKASAPAQVTVDLRPYFVQLPSSQNTSQGGSAYFSTTVRGAPPLSYRWRFNGRDLPGATEQGFGWPNVQPADAGFITVVVSNAAGSVESEPVRLTVAPAPQLERIWTRGGLNGTSARVAFSADGARLATATSEDVKIWRADGSLSTICRTYDERTLGIRWYGTLEFSPDGELLATAGGQGLMLWRTTDGYPDRRQLELPLGTECHAAAFSVDGRHLATAHDTNVHLWHVPDRRLLQTWNLELPYGRSLAFSHDGRWLALLSLEGISLFGVEDHSQRSHATREGLAVRFNPQGLLLVASREASSPGRHRVVLRQWDPNQAQPGPPVVIGPDPSEVSLARFSSNGDALLGMASGQLDVWRTGDRSHVLSLPTSGHFPEATIAPDGETLAVASERDSWIEGLGSVLTLCSFPGGAPLRVFNGHGGRIRTLEFSDDGARLLSAGEWERLSLWRTLTSEPELYLQTESGDLLSAGFIADGTSLAAVAGNSVVFHHLSDGSGYRTNWLETTAGRSAAFLADHAMLVTGAEPEPWVPPEQQPLVQLWRLSDGALLRSFRGHTSAVHALTVSTNRHVLASASEDGSVLVWRTSDGALRHRLPYTSTAIDAVALSPDGVWLAVAATSQDPLQPSVPRLDLWNVATGDQTASVDTESGRLTTLQFSPDGGSLIAAAVDRALQVRHVPGLDIAEVYHASVYPVTAVRFSPDGGLMALGMEDGTVAVARSPVASEGEDPEIKIDAGGSLDAAGQTMDLDAIVRQMGQPVVRGALTWRLVAPGEDEIASGPLLFNPVPGRWQARARITMPLVPGRYVVRLRVVTPTGDTGSGRLELEVPWPTVTVRGIVADARTGDPLAGVRVALFKAFGPDGFWTVVNERHGGRVVSMETLLGEIVAARGPALTSADGVFAWEVEPAGGIHVLLAAKAGFYQQASFPFAAQAADGVVERNIDLYAEQLGVLTMLVDQLYRACRTALAERTELLAEHYRDVEADDLYADPDLASYWPEMRDVLTITSPIETMVFLDGLGDGINQVTGKMFRRLATREILKNLAIYCAQAGVEGLAVTFREHIASQTYPGTAEDLADWSAVFYGALRARYDRFRVESGPVTPAPAFAMDRACQLLTASIRELESAAERRTAFVAPPQATQPIAALKMRGMVEQYRSVATLMHGAEEGAELLSNFEVFGTMLTAGAVATGVGAAGAVAATKLAGWGSTALTVAAETLKVELAHTHVLTVGAYHDDARICLQQFAASCDSLHHEAQVPHYLAADANCAIETQVDLNAVEILGRPVVFTLNFPGVPIARNQATVHVVNRGNLLTQVRAHASGTWSPWPGLEPMVTSSDTRGDVNLLSGETGQLSLRYSGYNLGAATAFLPHYLTVSTYAGPWLVGTVTLPFHVLDVFDLPSPIPWQYLAGAEGSPAVRRSVRIRTVGVQDTERAAALTTSSEPLFDAYLTSAQPVCEASCTVPGGLHALELRLFAPANQDLAFLVRDSAGRRLGDSVAEGRSHRELIGTASGVRSSPKSLRILQPAAGTYAVEVAWRSPGPGGVGVQVFAEHTPVLAADLGVMPGRLLLDGDQVGTQRLGLTVAEVSGQRALNEVQVELSALRPLGDAGELGVVGARQRALGRIGPGGQRDVHWTLSPGAETGRKYTGTITVRTAETGVRMVPVTVLLRRSREVVTQFTPAGEGEGGLPAMITLDANGAAEIRIPVGVGRRVLHAELTMAATDTAGGLDGIGIDVGADGNREWTGTGAGIMSVWLDDLEEAFQQALDRGTTAGEVPVRFTGVPGHKVRLLGLQVYPEEEVMRFAGVQVSEGQAVTLHLVAPDGVSGSIEVSSDLSHWTFLAPFVSHGQTLEFTDQPIAATPVRFYRAVAR